MVRCAIWYHLYKLKNVKNTHGGVLLLEIYISARITFFLKIQFYMLYATCTLFLITLMTAIYSATGKGKNPLVAVCSPLPLILLLFFIFACVELSSKY